MRWLDVAGPPGAGKSTICYPLWPDRAVGWDRKPPPPEWSEFLNAVGVLLTVTDGHASHVAMRRMWDRSLKKMATVTRLSGMGAYLGTGFVQRGIGLGWRLVDMGEPLDQLRPFFRLMPVSLGVVFLTAPREVLEQRNHDRRNNPATAHEDRAYQVRLQEQPTEIAKDELSARDVPWKAIDTHSYTPDAARAEMLRFCSPS